MRPSSCSRPRILRSRASSRCGMKNHPLGSVLAEYANLTLDCDRNWRPLPSRRWHDAGMAKPPTQSPRKGPRRPLPARSRCCARSSKRCCGSRAGPSTTPTTCDESHGRPEGRRPSGVVGLARHHHDGALFRGAAAAGPRRREAACESRSFMPSSICSATRPARSSKAFRGYKGAQSYPSRTKDVDDVDFSTGSVGLGVAQTLFSSLMQDYVRAHGWGRDRPEGRMVALVGDAELDEGNIFEAMLEGWKQGLRNCWWIIDYNRQSLDAVVREGLWERYETLFRAFGWDVVILKYGCAAGSRFRGAGRRAAARLDRQLPEPALFGAGVPGRRGVAQAAQRRPRRPGRRHAADRGAQRRRARAADDQSGGPRPADAARAPSARSTTTGRPASSATPSRATGCRSPATRTTMPA